MRCNHQSIQLLILTAFIWIVDLRIFAPESIAKLKLSFSSSVASAQTASEQKTEADRLLEQGIQQRAANQITEAVQSFQQALDQYRASSDRLGEMQASIKLGSALTNLGDYPQAIYHYEQALAIARERQDHEAEFQVLLEVSLPISYSDPERAFELLQQAAESIPQTSFPPVTQKFLEASVILTRLKIYFQQGNHQQVIQTSQQALAIIRDPFLRQSLTTSDPSDELERRVFEATVLSLLAQSYQATGQNQLAIKVLQDAYTIFHQLGSE
jgi:tetratricopeptide (TPR) repeat protein